MIFIGMIIGTLIGMVLMGLMAASSHRSRCEECRFLSREGEWIEQEDCWQCSECGDEFVLEVGVKPIDAKMNFCPNCGAHMKGDKQ